MLESYEEILDLPDPVFNHKKLHTILINHKGQLRRDLASWLKKRLGYQEHHFYFSVSKLLKHRWPITEHLEEFKQTFEQMIQTDEGIKKIKKVILDEAVMAAIFKLAYLLETHNIDISSASKKTISRKLFDFACNFLSEWIKNQNAIPLKSTEIVTSYKDYFAENPHLHRRFEKYFVCMIIERAFLTTCIVRREAILKAPYIILWLLFQSSDVEFAQKVNPTMKIVNYTGRFAEWKQEFISECTYLINEFLSSLDSKESMLYLRIDKVLGVWEEFANQKQARFTQPLIHLINALQLHPDSYMGHDEGQLFQEIFKKHPYPFMEKLQ